MAKYITPAVTPFLEDGKIDEKGAAALYEFLVKGGVDGILVFGSIGEFFAVSTEEKKKLISLAIRQINGRIPVIIGTADMILENVISLSNWSLKEGADAVIVVSPYYFKLTPDQIEEYYDRLAREIHGPLYIYNFPDRTGYTIPADVVKTLALKHKNIVGIKDTIPGMDHTRELIQAVKPVRPDFEIYSGFDENFAHNVLAGGDGCIAGLSNFAPSLCHQLAKAANEENWEEAARYSQTLNSLMDVYAVGNPFIPFIKKAVELAGVPIADIPSFPFPRPTQEQTEKLLQILKRNSIL
jgi:4-hydroxy-tetrahydrodipicolinate synthase